jgi:5-methylcytosine-specific restriction endonuclease McrA
VGRPLNFSRTAPTATQVEVEKNANGKPLCRWCREVVEPPKRTFCGKPECIHEWKIRSNPSYAREQVYTRDHGVCASCGLDTEKLKQLLHRIRLERGENAYRQFLNEIRAQYRASYDLDKHFWEADHIVPVAHGGGSCGLENLQTLCLACHKTKTQRQRRMKRKGKIK